MIIKNVSFYLYQLPRVKINMFAVAVNGFWVQQTESQMQLASYPVEFHMGRRDFPRIYQDVVCPFILFFSCFSFFFLL